MKSFKKISNEPYTPKVGDRVRIRRGDYKGTRGKVTEVHPGRHATVDNGFGGIRYHHDDLKRIDEDLHEMSHEKLRQYRDAAHKDYIDKMNTNRSKSIKRAVFKQKADIRLVGEDAAVPTNAVGSGNIAGANQDPPGKKFTKLKVVRRQLPKSGV
jgi:ribosomal protein L24